MEGKDDKQVDILHPLASLHWEEGTQLKVKMDTTQCVLVNDTLYVGGGKLSSGDHAQLFSSPIDLTSWSKMVTPTWSYGLTSYKSKVLLVGGRERKENGGRICNKLWAMTEPEKWESFLPSLPTKCHQPSAVGLKQCLIVAGGRDEDDQLLDKVEVLVDKQWSMVEPLPKPCCQMKSALHNGHCYFIGGQGQGRRVFYCNLSALLKKANSSICDKGDAIPLWSQFDTPLGYDSVASFGQELVLMGGIPFSRPYTSKVLVHSPHNQSLIEVARVPALLDNAATVVLSKREIVLVGRSRTGEESKGCQRVFKVTLQVAPFYPNLRFTMSSLSLLEAAGMPVLSSLSKLIEARALPLTWQSLFGVMTDMGLEDLSQEIVNYFYGNRSLREQCTAVVMSALTEQIKQNFLVPDQVALGLPPYLPTVTKHSLINDLRAHSQHPPGNKRSRTNIICSFQ